MYCKSCGKPPHLPSNYCLTDGTALLKGDVHVKLGGKSKYCQNCGNEGQYTHNYCLSCGTEMLQYTISSKGALFQATGTSSEQTSSLHTRVTIPKFSLASIKQALPYTLISLIILIITSFMVVSISQDTVTTLMNDRLEEIDFEDMMSEISEETGQEMPDVTKIIGITDILLLSHLQNSSLVIKGEGSESGSETEYLHGQFDLANGSLIYLLLPFISLFIGGILLGVQNRGENRDLLGLTCSMASIYGVVLSIISLFAGFSYKAKINDEFMTVSFSISNNYSFFSSLLLGFLFAFLFSGLGVLFSMNYRKLTGHLVSIVPYGEAVHQAVSTFFRGIGIIFVILFIYLSAKVNEFKEAISFFSIDMGIEPLLEKSSLFVVTISAQLSSYLWNLAHLSPLKLSLIDTGETEEVTFSALSGLKVGNEGSEFFLSFVDLSDIELYIKLIILLPIAFMIRAGYQLSFRSNDLIKSLLVYSLLYALILAGVAALSDIGFLWEYNMGDYDSENMGLGLGFSPFGVLIRGFLFALVFSYIGTWVRKLKS